MFQAEETGYQPIQGTKPQTLGFALNDSPVGLAAWIVEKFRTWCDCDGNPETIFTKDELLTNITLYGRPRRRPRRRGSTTRAATRRPVRRPATIEVPTACADFQRRSSGRRGAGWRIAMNLALDRDAARRPFRRPRVAGAVRPRRAAFFRTVR